MKISTKNKISHLKVKAIEKSKEKSKKVLHMIFLGMSTRDKQYGSRVASYPLR